MAYVNITYAILIDQYLNNHSSEKMLLQVDGF